MHISKIKILLVILEFWQETKGKFKSGESFTGIWESVCQVHHGPEVGGSKTQLVPL